MREWVLAIVGGLLVATGGPPFPVPFVAAAFFGVVLFASTLRTARKRGGALRGLLFGTAANLVAMSFVPGTITTFTDLPRAAAWLALLLLSLGQALPWVVTGTLTVALRRLPFPLAFAIALGLGAYVPVIFPWTIAAPLGRVPVLLQAAELIGERGVAVVVASMAALAVDERARRRSLMWAGGTLLALAVYGMFARARIDRLRAAAKAPLVALVQQSVPPKARWRPENGPAIASKLRALTRIAEAEGAGLAIWPESAWPLVLPHAAQRDDQSIPAHRIHAGVRIPVITGLLTEAPAPTDASGHWYYNATLVVQRDGSIPQPSAKLALLAFGETVPLGDLFPSLRRAFARAGGLVPGEAVVLLPVDDLGVRAGILNCYEDTLPGVGRQTARAGPNLLVNVTNDAWFGDSAEPELHLLEAIPRAIEARRDLVRAVNTGVTAHIDATGRVVARAEREIATILLVRPALLEEPPTMYARFGDATFWVGLALAALVAILRARSPVQRKTG